MQYKMPHEIIILKINTTKMEQEVSNFFKLFTNKNLFVYGSRFMHGKKYCEHIYRALCSGNYTLNRQK
jgi:hypothetical protein